MAFLSACSVHEYFAGLSCRSTTLSSTPRTKPLKPVERISLSGPTTTQPVFAERSLLQPPIIVATSKKRRSQVSDMAVITLLAEVPDDDACVAGMRASTIARLRSGRLRFLQARRIFSTFLQATSPEPLPSPKILPAKAR